MISVTSALTVKQVEGADCPVPAPKLFVRSIFSYPRWVELEIDGKRVSLDARDLHAAIDNATNVSQ